MNILLLLLILLIPTYSYAGLIKSNNFESGFSSPDDFDHCPPSATCPPPAYQSVPNPAAISLVNSPTYDGTGAVLHIAKPGVIAGGGANPAGYNPCYLFGVNYANDKHCDRSESEWQIGYVDGRDEWYGFAFRPDSRSQFSNTPSFVDQNGIVIFQAHQLGGSCGSGFGPRFTLLLSVKPPLTGGTSGNLRYILDTQNNTLPACPSTGGAGYVRRQGTLVSWNYDTWYKVVIHARWSTNPSLAFLQVYIDDVLLFDSTTIPGMITGFNGNSASDIKLGDYASWWTVQNPPAGEQFYIIHDAVKIGNQFSNYAEVAPVQGGVIVPPAETPAAPSNLRVLPST